MKGGKDQELIQSSTTPDPGNHMGPRKPHGKVTKTQLNITNNSQNLFKTAILKKTKNWSIRLIIAKCRSKVLQNAPRELENF